MFQTSSKKWGGLHPFYKQILDCITNMYCSKTEETTLENEILFLMLVHRTNPSINYAFQVIFLVHSSQAVISNPQLLLLLLLLLLFLLLSLPVCLGSSLWIWTNWACFLRLLCLLQVLHKVSPALNSPLNLHRLLMINFLTSWSEETKYHMS